MERREEFSHSTDFASGHIQSIGRKLLVVYMHGVAIKYPD
jgi:hypothetical protein